MTTETDIKEHSRYKSFLRDIANSMKFNDDLGLFTGRTDIIFGAANYIESLEHQLAKAATPAVLSSNAQVGGASFGVGVNESTVIRAAQRHYAYRHDETRPRPFPDSWNATEIASMDAFLEQGDRQFVDRTEYEALQRQLAEAGKDAERRILEIREAALNAANEWSNYVEVDSAPMTCELFVARAIYAIKENQHEQ